VVSPRHIEAERAALPELPAAKVARLVSSLGLPAYDAQVLTAEVDVANYFEAVVAAGAEPKAAANWVMTEAMSGRNETGAFAVSASALAALAGLVKDGTVSLQAAKKVFAEVAANGGEPLATAERLGLVQVRDTSALEGWVTEVLAANPGEVARFRAGEAKLLGFLVGQVMKKSQGKADPKGVQPVLLKALAGDH
jgi:aspartyl-tRNA(Asn)/glutamyl-tRNA(Gln) amidotransferase subunit B